MALFIRLAGLSDYAEVHQLQRELVAQRAEGLIPDVVLLLEHAEVITVGRKRHAQQNVLDPGAVPVVSVERGGDATWHGPGQLVAYPILKLEGRRADLHLHMRSLEEAVIALLQSYGLKPRTDPRNTGVWLPSETGGQKVCSVGIACRRWVSWHGLALNLSPDLSRFQQIHPCGFEASIMTSAKEHLGWSPSAQATAAPLAKALAVALEVPMEAPMHTAAQPARVIPWIHSQPQTTPSS